MTFVLPSSDMSEARSYSRDYVGYYGKGRDYRQAGAAADMLGAFSDWSRDGGYGCTPCCGGGGYGGSSASFFSDGTLFALLAGAALAFYILYTTITMANARNFRRKRAARKWTEEPNEEPSLFDGFEDIVWQGRSTFIISRVSRSNFKPVLFNPSEMSALLLVYCQQ